MTAKTPTVYTAGALCTQPSEGLSLQNSPYCTPEISVNDENGSGIIAPIRCKRWSCPHCIPNNRARVIKEAINGKPKRMLTLTVSSTTYPDAATAAAELKRGLTLLRLSLKRHPRLQDFEFIAIFEKHLSGAPHLHLLIRGKFIPWAWLRRRWEAITTSTHIDIRKIHGRKDAARYVAKYLGKDLASFPGCKRWWRSHGYAIEIADAASEPQQPQHWQRYTANLDTLCDAWERQGWNIRRRRGGIVEYERPPDDDWDVHWHITRAQTGWYDITDFPLLPLRGQRP